MKETVKHNWLFRFFLRWIGDLIVHILWLFDVIPGLTIAVIITTGTMCYIKGTAMYIVALIVVGLIYTLLFTITMELWGFFYRRKERK